MGSGTEGIGSGGAVAGGLGSTGVGKGTGTDGRGGALTAGRGGTVTGDSNDGALVGSTRTSGEFSTGEVSTGATSLPTSASEPLAGLALGLRSLAFAGDGDAVEAGAGPR